MARPAPVLVDPGAPAVAPDAPVEVRFLAPDEAAELCSAIRRCYGETYDAAWVYDPEEIARRLRDGTMVSVVGVADDVVVGHVAMTRLTPDAVVGEAGQAVVDPAYRGHHLFETLKRTLADHAREQGLIGLYSEATAAHPYSQRANLALGACETGFLLGYIPASVEYVAIEKQAPRRQSAALFFLSTNVAPPRALHPPEWYRSAVAGLVSHLGLARDVTSAGARTPARTTLAVDVRADHNEAFVTVEELGGDAFERIATTTSELCRRGLDCVYLDLRLTDPHTALLPAELQTELGYFFAGVIPELRNGDVLRLQLLNGVEVDASDVATASDFGAELLAYVLETKSQAAAVRRSVPPPTK